MRKKKGDVVYFNKQAYANHIKKWYNHQPSDYVGMEDLAEGEHAILDVKGSEDDYHYELKEGVFVHAIWCRRPKD